MTMDNQETGIPLWAFVAGAAVLIIGAFAAIWFMFPGPDSRHTIVSPSGDARIELGELCAEVGCSRVAILDQGGLRSGCPLALPGNTPLLKDVTATWSGDDSSVDLAYVSAHGDAGSVVIEIADCTLTE